MSGGHGAIAPIERAGARVFSLIDAAAVDVTLAGGKFRALSTPHQTTRVPLPSHEWRC
jgi:hypothetical protein